MVIIYKKEDGEKEYRIDKKSQRILHYLQDAEARTSELREIISADTNRQVRYRTSEYLIPAGLVEVLNTKTPPSGGKPVKIYCLTDKGEEFARDRDLDSPANIDDVVDSLQDLKSRVTEIEEDVEKQARRIDNRPTSDTFRRTRDEYDDAVQEAKNAAKLAQSAAQSADKDAKRRAERVVEDRIEDFKSELDDIIGEQIKRIDKLDEQAEDLDEQVESIDQRLTDIEGRIDAAEDRLDSVENRTLRDLLPF